METFAAKHCPGAIAQNLTIMAGCFLSCWQLFARSHVVRSPHAPFLLICCTVTLFAEAAIVTLQ